MIFRTVLKFCLILTQTPIHHFYFRFFKKNSLVIFRFSDNYFITKGGIMYELKNLQQKHNREREQLERNYKREKKSLEDRFSRQKKDIQRRHDREMENLQRKLAS